MFILGTHSDAGKGILSVPKLDLLYHTAFIGQSGSGKSFAISRLIEEIVLRTRARIIVLDPNGDFGSVYRPREENFWTEGKYSTTLEEIDSRTSSKITHYDQRAEFEARWNAVKFQFIAADRNNWIPFREGANAAPLKLHWKWLPRAEQDFFLSVDATQFPTINQGIQTCFHYINDHEAEFPQQFSLVDLEDIALNFATKRIAMAPYPEAYSLSDIDWLSVRLQFRSLRKKFYKLWFPEKLKEKDTAPSDLTNYLHNGFWSNNSWQMCVVGLAGLDPLHMLLAADVTLACLWSECMNTWRFARQKAFKSHAEEMNL